MNANDVLQKEHEKIINSPIEQRIIYIQKCIYLSGHFEVYDGDKIYDNFTMDMISALKPVFEKWSVK